MDEFEFISKYLTRLCGPEALDLKDDVAVWTPPPNVDAIISMDTIVEGVHFPDGKFDAEIAQKLIRVNISDLVAKGADPVGYFLSLSLSKHVSENNLNTFCDGLARDQQRFGLKLWGGDTTSTSGVNVLGLTIIGTIPHGRAVLRRGAKLGDFICVTGNIGDAYLGLKVVMGEIKSTETDLNHWINSYHVPNPPFAMRHKIREFASAALDVSDGLIADAGHLSRASKIGIRIELDTIPFSPETRDWAAKQDSKTAAIESLVTGGDDYQVLLSLSEANYNAAIKAGLTMTKIGMVTHGNGIVCTDANGQIVDVKKTGYTHF